MQAIVLAIIPGLFSLAGIWYQNYLRTRSLNTDTTTTNSTSSEKSIIPRVGFTLLVTLLPWMIWGFTLQGINHTVHENLHTYAEIMGLYLLFWIVITLLALTSGWKFKTLVEKILLVGSLFLLIYWECWMVVVHDLLHMRSLK